MSKDVTDDMLMAFVDNELAAPEMAEIAAAIERNPDIAARAERFQRSRLAAQSLFDPVLSASPPAHLVAAITGDRTDTSRRRRGSWSWPDWLTRPAMMPLAASVLVAIGLAGGYLLAGFGGMDRQTGLAPGGAQLALALASQPSGEPSPLVLGGAEAQLAVTGSYPVEGGLCRSFALSTTDEALRGIGCDRGEGYRVEMSMAEQPGGGFVAASDRVSRSLDAYLSAIGAGGPLSAEDEATQLRR